MSGVRIYSSRFHPSFNSIFIQFTRAGGILSCRAAGPHSHPFGEPLLFDLASGGLVLLLYFIPFRAFCQQFFIFCSGCMRIWD